MVDKCSKCQNIIFIYKELRNINGINYDVFYCSKCKEEYIEKIDFKKEQDWQ